MEGWVDGLKAVLRMGLRLFPDCRIPDLPQSQLYLGNQVLGLQCGHAPKGCIPVPDQGVFV